MTEDEYNKSVGSEIHISYQNIFITPVKAVKHIKWKYEVDENFVFTLKKADFK